MVLYKQEYCIVKQHNGCVRNDGICYRACLYSVGTCEVWHLTHAKIMLRNWVQCSLSVCVRACVRACVCVCVEMRTYK